jgi:hypothetical protein
LQVFTFLLASIVNCNKLFRLAGCEQLVRVFVDGQDMEKWAKKLNAQKDQFKDMTKTVPTQPAVAEPIVQIQPTSATADAGFSLLEKVVASCIMCH